MPSAAMRTFYALAIISHLIGIAQGVFRSGLNTDVRLDRPEGTRRYDIFIAEGLVLDPPPALLFSLHAALSNKFDQRAFTNWGERAIQDKNFIPVWPQGRNDVWDVVGPTDRDFIVALIEEIKLNVTIDESRIYMTGYSNGGTFAQWFGYKEPTYVAAVASLAGDFSSSTRDDALIDKAAGRFTAVPVFLIHGYNDQIACWSNWHCFTWKFRHREANEQNWLHWAVVNNCVGEPTTLAKKRGFRFGFGHHIHNGHREFFWIKAYERCDANVEVRQLLNSRDHSGEFWSGNMMGTQKEYNDKVLEFLFRFSSPHMRIATTDMQNATNSTDMQNATNSADMQNSTNSTDML